MAAFALGGDLWATGDETGLVHVWSAESRSLVSRCRATPRGHSPSSTSGSATELLALSFGSDGASLVAVGKDGWATITDVANGTRWHDLPLAGDALTAAAVSADGRLVATGDDDGGIRVWSTPDQSRIIADNIGSNRIAATAACWRPLPDCGRR